MTDTQWLMRIEGQLSAHFIQPDGSSRPGIDWSVRLKHGDATYKIFVRTHFSDDLTPHLRKDTNYLGQTVMGFLNDLLQTGWTPDQPHQLVIVIQNPPG